MVPFFYSRYRTESVQCGPPLGSGLSCGQPGGNIIGNGETNHAFMQATERGNPHRSAPALVRSQAHQPPKSDGGFRV